MTRTSKTDWVPTIGLALITGLVAFAGATYRADQRAQLLHGVYTREARAFEQQYGAQRRWSEFGEEWYVRDFFHDRREGVFLDVGANHYRDSSNTYFLETTLGWSGIAIEPQTQFAAAYTQFRPRTRFVPMFASDVADRRVTLFVPPDEDRIASVDKSFAEQGGKTQAQDVPTTTLDHVLREAGIDHLDFLSIDIELHEPQALKGFDVDHYKPALVCIEAHPEVRQAILDYFQQHRYVLVGKYLRADLNNLWFAPAAP